jgi:uncharacterized membrane protein HdeD (DUF308 family)
MVQGYTQQNSRGKGGWASYLSSGRTEAGKLFSGTFFEKVTFIPFIFTFWVLFTGVSKTIMSFEVKKVDKKLGSTLLWTGILGIIAGIIMMGRPLMTGIFVTYTIAFVFIYQGIVSIILYFKSKKA